MNRRTRRKRRLVRGGVLLILLLAVLAVVFLFQAKTVTVYGNTRHTEEEIKEGLMNNILHKNTLYLQWEYRNGRVTDALPFLKSLKVSMKSPTEIEVQVVEKEPVGYLDKGEYVYFDEDGVVLELSDKEDSDYPVITGVEVDDPVLYQKLPMQSSAQLRTILSITQLLKYQELQAKEIRFGENGDITVYVGGVEALLGQDEYLEEKIANLSAILNKMGDEHGTLHLESFTGKSDLTTFTPSQETETETELQTDAGDGTGDGSADTGDGTGTASGTTGDTASGTTGDTASGTTGDEAGDSGDSAGDSSQADESSSSVVIAMVFDSSGNLVYNVHVENGTVVDSNGNPVSGCSVNENGDVVDAYMNVFDGKTGELSN